MTDRVRLMSEAELRNAAHTLAKAFFKDPLQTYTFPDEAERRDKSPAHFTAALNYGLKFGVVYVADRDAGAVILLKPGETEITPERAEQGGFASLPEQIGTAAFERFFSVIGFGDQYHKLDAPDPHWYTMVLGVDPAFQGLGFGKALMQPVMAKAKADKVPIYLETAQPSNVAFYCRLGFSVIRDLVEPSSGIRLWTFRLDP